MDDSDYMSDCTVRSVANALDPSRNDVPARAIWSIDSSKHDKPKSSLQRDNSCDDKA